MPSTRPGSFLHESPCHPARRCVSARLVQTTQHSDFWLGCEASRVSERQPQCTEPVVGDKLLRDGRDHGADRTRGRRTLRQHQVVMDPTHPAPTFEAMLGDLRDRVRDEIDVSDDLATAIVAEWRGEALRRGLIWWEEAYWSEAVLWIEQWFPPGLGSVTVFTAQSEPTPAATARRPRSSRRPHRTSSGPDRPDISSRSPT